MLKELFFVGYVYAKEQERAIEVKKVEFNEDLHYMTEALLYEARGEPLDGLVAVAEVIINRVKSGEFPNTIKGVVTQRINGKCQFSYHCDPLFKQNKYIITKKEKKICYNIAKMVLSGNYRRRLSNGFIMYHSVNLPEERVWYDPDNMTTTIIGEHVFLLPKYQY